MIPGDSFTMHYHYSEDGNWFLHDHPNSYIFDDSDSIVHDHADEPITFYTQAEVSNEVH